MQTNVTADREIHFRSPCKAFGDFHLVRGFMNGNAMAYEFSLILV